MNTPNRFLFLVSIVFLVGFLVFILPILNLGMGFAMQLLNQSYLTAENLPLLLTNPPTLLILFLSLFLISSFLLFQLITMIHCCNSDKVQKKPNILSLLRKGLRKTIHCITAKNLALPFLALLLFLFMNLPLLLVVTCSAKFDLPDGASDAVFLKMLLLLIYSLLGFIAFRGIFAVHFCINEHQDFQNSFELSKSLLRGRSIRTAIILILYNLGLIVGFYFLYYTILFIVAVFVFLFAEKSMVITVFLSIYPRINRSLIAFFPMIAFFTNINLITALYTRYHNEDFKDILTENIHQPPKNILPKKPKHKRTVNAFLLFVIITGFINFYITARNGSFYLADTLSGILISSHRGNSHVAPENTLPALENAIIAGSDYAEIDIRQTKDGSLVLLHDKSLLRTAGLDENIWTLNLIDLMQLDAGSWFGKEYVKTRIPTLEEALIFCKGRIQLNIEIKADTKGNRIEERLVALIDNYDYEHQCLISSSNYHTLVKIKQLNHNLKTGLVMSTAYGNFYNKEYVDFFSIRSRYINREVVESAHRVGKEVHAWTVNKVKEIDRMKSIGVDCIITDNPTLAREILMQDDTSKTFLELLRRMLGNNSFYSLLPN
jgi:glycerophosphoryl diester phosphodiesterase